MSRIKTDSKIEINGDQVTIHKGAKFADLALAMHVFNKNNLISAIRKDFKDHYGVETSGRYKNSPYLKEGSQFSLNALQKALEKYSPATPQIRQQPELAVPVAYHPAEKQAFDAAIALYLKENRSPQADQIRVVETRPQEVPQETNYGAAATSFAVHLTFSGGAGMGGVAVGAAIGTAICPGLGTAIGAAVGGFLFAGAGEAAAQSALGEKTSWGGIIASGVVTGLTGGAGAVAVNIGKTAALQAGSKVVTVSQVMTAAGKTGAVKLAQEGAIDATLAVGSQGVGSVIDGENELSVGGTVTAVVLGRGGSL